MVLLGQRSGRVVGDDVEADDGDLVGLVGSSGLMRVAIASSTSLSLIAPTPEWIDAHLALRRCSGR